MYKRKTKINKDTVFHTPTWAQPRHRSEGRCPRKIRPNRELDALSWPNRGDRREEGLASLALPLALTAPAPLNANQWVLTV